MTLKDIVKGVVITTALAFGVYSAYNQKSPMEKELIAYAEQAQEGDFESAKEHYINFLNTAREAGINIPTKINTVPEDKIKFNKLLDQQEMVHSVIMGIPFVAEIKSRATIGDIVDYSTKSCSGFENVPVNFVEAQYDSIFNGNKDGFDSLNAFVKYNPPAVFINKTPIEKQAIDIKKTGSMVENKNNVYGEVNDFVIQLSKQKNVSWKKAFVDYATIKTVLHECDHLRNPIPSSVSDNQREVFEKKADKKMHELVFSEILGNENALPKLYELYE